MHRRSRSYDGEFHGKLTMPFCETCFPPLPRPHRIILPRISSHPKCIEKARNSEAHEVRCMIIPILQFLLLGIFSYLALQIWFTYRVDFASPLAVYSSYLAAFCHCRGRQTNGYDMGKAVAVRRALKRLPPSLSLLRHFF